MTWVEELVSLVLRNGGGIGILPPDPTTIAANPKPVGQVTREDETVPPPRIVMQAQGDGPKDGGDSANRTGILAFCGSPEDAANIPKFVGADGLMFRHPTDKSDTHDHTNPFNCSRDQLVGYVAGCWRTGRTDIVRTLLADHSARGWLCQNTERDIRGGEKTICPDPLFPHEQMYLKVCAGEKDAHLDLLGQAMLQATIEAIPLQPADVEINQLVLECIVCGRLDHFVEFVPNYQERLNDYWGGWRKQQQIADNLGEVVRIELRRYTSFHSLSFPPLPVFKLAFIKDAIQQAYDALTHINWWTKPDNVFLSVPKASLDGFVAALKDGEQQLKYFVKNADALKAMGTSIAQGIGEILRQGPGIGGPFGAAIFGGSTRTEWNEEVDRRLSQIEQKLDSIIAFMSNQLPALVQNALTEALLAQKVNDIKGARVGLGSALVAYQTERSPENKAALRHEADSIARLGVSLAQNGPAWYAGTILAFTAMSSGYSRLILNDPALLAAFKNYAEEYGAIASRWLDVATSRSVAEVNTTSGAEYEAAKKIIDRQPLGNFLLAISLGPIAFGETSYMGFADPNWGRQHTYWGYKAWIDPKTGGQWNGNWGDKQVVNVDEGAPMTPALFASTLGWKHFDLVQTPMPPVKPSEAGDHFNGILALINNAQRVVDVMPARLVELSVAEKAIKNFKESCDQILKLE